MSLGDYVQTQLAWFGARPFLLTHPFGTADTPVNGSTVRSIHATTNNATVELVPRYTTISLDLMPTPVLFPRVLSLLVPGNSACEAYLACRCALAVGAQAIVYISFI